MRIFTFLIFDTYFCTNTGTVKALRGKFVSLKLPHLKKRKRNKQIKNLPFFSFKLYCWFWNTSLKQLSPVQRQMTWISNTFYSRWLISPVLPEFFLRNIYIEGHISKYIVSLKLFFQNYDMTLTLFYIAKCQIVTHCKYRCEHIWTSNT